MTARSFAEQETYNTARGRIRQLASIGIKRSHRSFAEGRDNCLKLRVFSIDNASTRDIDDALSFEWET